MGLRTRFLLFFTFAMATASALQAQTIRVQTGDHPGFTRLVLPIGAEREWDLNQQPDGQWVLSLTPSVDGFDVSTAFNLIQRSRLSDLIATQSLFLDLACACDVTSFRHDTRYLVIDITDPDPNAAPPVAEAVDPAIEERAAAAQALPDLANLLRFPSGLPQVNPPTAATATPAPSEPTETSAPNPRLAEAAQIMAEQLARAAASGLLDVALNEPMTIGDPTDNTPSLPNEHSSNPEVSGHSHEEEASPDADGPSHESPSGALPIRAETAFDRAVQLDLPIGPPREATSCNGAPFVVAEWSEGGGVYQNIGALRRDLFDERDVLTTVGALSLAQHYLYYGFGAEAIYWLEQLDDPPEPLLHVAALVDGADTAPFHSG